MGIRILCLMLFHSLLLHSQVVFNEAPRNGALIPRSISTNYADAKFIGSVSGSYTRIRYRCWQNGKLFHDQTAALVYNSGNANFNKLIKIKAGLYRYDFQISLFGTDTITREIVDVVAGDVYIIQGQSNAVANAYNGLSNPSYQDSWIRSFGNSSPNATISSSDSLWRIANGDGIYGAGCIGQWGLVMAKTLSDSFGIPIAIINGAVGGTSVKYHQRYSPDPANINTCYGRLLTRMRKAGLANKVRGIFWFQGESDGTNPVLHDTLFRKLYSDWMKDYKGMEQNYLVQVRSGGCGNPTPVMLEIQRQFEFSLSKLKVISSNGLNGHDGCHYAFKNGYQQLGLQFAAMVGRDLYGSRQINHIDPPNIQFANYSNSKRDEIELTMLQQYDSIFADPGFYSLFSITGDNAVSITSGFLRNNKVVLKLNQGTCSRLFLSYIGKSGKQPWVKNRLGSGLIGFHLLPVADQKVKTAYTSCKGQQLVLGNDSIPGVKYQWTNQNSKKVKSTAMIYEEITVDMSFQLVLEYDLINCKFDSFIVHVYTDQFPHPVLGNDTTLCHGAWLSKNIESGQFKNVTWRHAGIQTNSNTYLTNKAGLLTVTVTSGLGCVASDSLYIAVSNPEVFLPADVSVCAGKDTMISAPNGFKKYWWNGVEGNNTERFSAGEIQLKVRDTAGCFDSDTMYVLEIQPAAQATVLKSICPYDSAVIVKPDNCLEWSLDGILLKDKHFLKGGKHTFLCKDFNHCDSKLEAVIKTLDIPEFSLGKDTGFCKGGSISLKCPYYTHSYYWNGSKQSHDWYTVREPGWISCKVSSLSGCFYEDSVYVQEYALPDFHWPSDTQICSGITWAPTLPVKYKYELNGIKTTHPQITYTGNYSLNAISDRGCNNAKLSQVSFISCFSGMLNHQAEVPVIYPNPVKDKIFTKLTEGWVTVYSMSGKLVLAAEIEPNSGINISKLSPGTYVLILGNQRQLFEKL